MYSQLHGWKALVFLCVMHVCTLVLVLADKLPGSTYAYLLIGSGAYAAGNTVLKKHQEQQASKGEPSQEFKDTWH